MQSDSVQLESPRSAEYYNKNPKPVQYTVLRFYDVLHVHLITVEVGVVRRSSKTMSISSNIGRAHPYTERFKRKAREQLEVYNVNSKL